MSNTHKKDDIIQSIQIKQTETRSDSSATTGKKHYTAYRIDVQAPVRRWHIWKRYSDFTKLHEQLSQTFPGVPLPAQLPQKRIFPPTIYTATKVEDRRQGLETYLRTIASYRDDRWRKTDIWIDFIALPNMNNNNSQQQITCIGTWLDEYDDLVAITKEIRSLLNSQNTHQNQNQISDAMRCEVKAKKDLMSLHARLSVLEEQTANSFFIAASTTMTEGEERRRTDKLNDLQRERDVLTLLLNTKRKDLAGPVNGSSTIAKKENKSTVMSLKKGDTEFSGRISSKGIVSGRGRAFGTALAKQLQETEATKGLDNQQLLGYQNQTMKDQDLHVEQFSQILSRQKELGFSILHELDHQVEVLEDLEVQVEKTSNKLHFANKKLSKIK